MPKLLNAFTVDVEDYYQVSAFERDIPRASWGQFGPRVVASTRRILEVLSRHGVRATFFVLGWTAERYPGLVREIFAAGHEVGCHSHWHRLVYELSPEVFRHDLRQARDAIAAACGAEVTLYRAPSFSITKASLWALEIMVEEGFKIDSSIFPVIHDRYGIPDAEPGIHRLSTPAGELWEFPPTVCQLGRLRIPVSGGGYFRLYPQWLTRRLLGRIGRREGRPFVFYVHPWEVDPDQPRLPFGSRLTRLRHYLNLRWTEHKLDGLLSSFAFGTVSQAVDAFRCGLPPCAGHAPLLYPLPIPAAASPSPAIVPERRAS